MNAYNSYQIAVLLTCLSTGILAFFVLAIGAGRPVTRLFGIYTLAISAWAFCWFKMISVGTYSGSLFWSRFLHYPASFIPATFLHFVQYLLGVNEQKKQIVLRRLFYVLGIVFLSIAFTPDFVKTVVPKQVFAYYLEPGQYYLTFLVFFVAAIVAILSLLIQTVRSSRGFKKTQTSYVLVAYILAYTGGTAVFLPVYNLSLPWFALYLIPLCHVIVAYTIFAHRLMDITIIIRKTLIYSVVMGSLAIVYLGIVTISAKIFQGLTGYQTVFSPAVVAFLATFCFQPLRKRVQAFVDRKFFRQYVDREEKLYELSREVITHTTSEAMASSLIRVLSETLYPKSTALYLRARDGDGFVQVGQRGATDLPLQVPESNALTSYFVDHPQPFVQDLPADVGGPQNTRSPSRKEDAA